MRKLILLLSLLPLWGPGGLYAANCISVNSVGVNYATKTVTFVLTWKACNGTTHLNKAWVFVDWQQVTGTNTTGTWTRATISGAATVTNGTYTTGNTTGFYVTGTNGQSATVTVKLSNAPAKFNWCAIATDYPPNATMSNGTYTLKGTPPFVVNGIKLDNTQKSYTGSCITSITDATNNPEGFTVSPPFAAGAIANGSTFTPVSILPSITIGNSAAASGGDNKISYTWQRVSSTGTSVTVATSGLSYALTAADVATQGTYTFYRYAKDNTCNTTLARAAGSWVLNVIPASTFSGCSVWIEKASISTSYAYNDNTIASVCQQRYGGQWRLPNATEAICICNNRKWLENDIITSISTGCTTVAIWLSTYPQRLGGCNIGCSTMTCNWANCGGWVRCVHPK